MFDVASGSGAFSSSFNTDGFGAGTNSGIKKKDVSFNASRVVTTASEVRPYSFVALPLIAY